MKNKCWFLEPLSVCLLTLDIDKQSSHLLFGKQLSWCQATYFQFLFLAVIVKVDYFTVSPQCISLLQPYCCMHKYFLCPNYNIDVTCHISCMTNHTPLWIFKLKNVYIFYICVQLTYLITHRLKRERKQLFLTQLRVQQGFFFIVMIYKQRQIFNIMQMPAFEDRKYSAGQCCGHQYYFYHCHHIQK